MLSWSEEWETEQIGNSLLSSSPADAVAPAVRRFFAVPPMPVMRKPPKKTPYVLPRGAVEERIKPAELARVEKSAATETREVQVAEKVGLAFRRRSRLLCGLQNDPAAVAS